MECRLLACVRYTGKIKAITYGQQLGSPWNFQLNGSMGRTGASRGSEIRRIEIFLLLGFDLQFSSRGREGPQEGKWKQAKQQQSKKALLGGSICFRGCMGRHPTHATCLPPFSVSPWLTYDEPTMHMLCLTLTLSVNRHHQSCICLLCLATFFFDNNLFYILSIQLA
jgi:hypothetical protein